MAKLEVNLSGRVKNLNISPNHSKVPLFEALSNSLQAINEKNSNEKRITIKIIRDQEEITSEKDEKRRFAPITGFIVEDNGIGLNDVNFNSFLTTDSNYKEKLGGKGVGRLTYLACFEKAEFNSTFEENGKYYSRRFIFDNSNDIDDTMFIQSSDCCTGTMLKLHPYKDKFADYLPDTVEELSKEIISNFLLDFLHEDCPSVQMIDGQKNLNLNDIANKMVFEKSEYSSFNLGDETFTMRHVLVNSELYKCNELAFFAHGRAAKKMNLEKLIVDLKSKIKKNGTELYYLGILESDYLNRYVTVDRTDFNIPKKDNDDEFDLTRLSMEAIERSCVEVVEKYLEDYLVDIREEKIGKYRSVIDKKMPQYKHLETHRKDDMVKLKPNLSDDKLEEELHRIDWKLRKETSQRVDKFVSTIDRNGNLPDGYSNIVDTLSETLSDISKSSLTQYVIHRKAIIKLLEGGLAKKSDERFQLEKYIHSLIYPMRTTSEEIEYSNHNLWLIDERLSFSRYISSDVPITRAGDRTDILILDNPIAVSDNPSDGNAYGTLTIFELKRPMRDNYSENDNPIKQLKGYLSRIKSGVAKDKNGRMIKVTDQTKVYLYAVCDITESLRKILIEEDFTETPDKLGMYKYHSNFNAHIEVISYDKIVSDAKMRNRVFFEMLGILE